MIFDLDDTLIDTSVCLTPPKLEEALICMIKNGAQVPSFFDAFKELLEINVKAGSGADALKKFCEHFSLDDSFCQLGIKMLYGESQLDMPISPVNGALDLLKSLSSECHLALVSVGIEKQQLAKMEKAGIDWSVFSKIAIIEDKNKGKCYQEIFGHFPCPKEKVFVCGDKILIDLSPAKRLGFTTIHVRNGRGKHVSGYQEDVDYSVQHLEEIKKIVGIK
ncbi:MAG: HAD family hydrolase [Rhabdochlamydiaceae bacterium]